MSKAKGKFNKTITNANLRNHLLRWIQLSKAALDLTNPSAERAEAILMFCRAFVPSDVTEDDIEHFSHSLSSDEEFFESLHRELTQCESGQNLENIEGDQISKAIFTLLPMEGTLSENSTLDIVREVGFISGDGGNTWTAEVIFLSPYKITSLRKSILPTLQHDFLQFVEGSYMSFFNEKSTKLLDFPEDSEDEFDGLSTYNYESDCEDYSKLISTYKSDNLKTKPAEVPNNDATVVPQKRFITSSTSFSNPAKKMTLSSLPPPKPIGESPITKTNEPKRELQFKKIEFNAAKKTRANPSDATIGEGNTKSINSTEGSKELNNIPDESLYKFELTKDNTTNISQSKVSSTLQPTIVTTISPSESSGGRSPTPIAKPARVSPVDSGVPMFVANAMNIVSECNQAHNKVLAIQKGLDDVTVMYRDTIKVTLIRDREELAEHSSRVLEVDPIYESVPQMNEVESLISGIRMKLKTIFV